MAALSYGKHLALFTRRQLCQHEQAPSRCVLAAVLGRPMNLTGKHMPGARCSGGHINISTVVHTIETHLPLPDLACCIVRRGLTR